MKTLCTLALVLISSCALMAQQNLYLSNSTSCQLMVQTYSQVSGSCTGGIYQNNIVAAGAGFNVTAPAGEEWMYVEITSFPYCSGGVAVAVGTPMNCNSTCSWGAPNFATVTNNGCNGCQPNVSAYYEDCAGANQGVLRIWDF